MLASFSCPDRVFGVHPIGKDDIDDIDVRILRDLIVVFVIVAVLSGNAVLSFPFLDFGRGSTDNPGKVGMLGLLKSGSDLIGA